MLVRCSLTPSVRRICSQNHFNILLWPKKNEVMREGQEGMKTKRRDVVLKKINQKQKSWIKQPIYVDEGKFGIFLRLF